MDLGIAGKIALVIAGSKGLGEGAVRGLAAEGVRVAFTARNSDTAADLAREVGGHVFDFDTDDLDDIDRLLQEVTETVGPIDIVVLNTGGPPSHDHPFDTTVSEWTRAHRSLVLSPFEMLRRIVPAMAKRGWGRVIVISSYSAHEPIDRIPLANAYRPPILANLKLLAKLYGRDGITFNAMIPGLFRTERSMSGRSDDVIRLNEERSPLGRMGTIEEFGSYVAFLSSERASYVTATEVLIDGGLSTVARL